VDSEKSTLYFLIAVIILIIFFLGFSFGKEYANPCVEYSTDCEIVCSGTGDAYDCWKECPCIRRKYE